MGQKQSVFLSSPFKKSTTARSANSGASNPKTAPKDPNKNEENLKVMFVTENMNFKNTNLTSKANKKVSLDQNQQQITDLITFANFDANSSNMRQRLGPI